jgi:hypothetical protein
MKEKFIIPWPVIASALFVFVFTNLFSYFIFSHIPHVNDEIGYLFQAKILKTGKLYFPSPCAKEFFDFSHIINDGKWYSQYPPGHPFLLLLGLLAGAPWIINPILASLSIFLFYFLGKEIYDARIGLLTAVLASISPWFLMMSSTFLSHTSCMFFFALFLLFLFRSFDKPSLLNGSLAGLGLGMAFLIRPYTAVLLSVIFLILYASKLFKNFRRILKNSIALGLVIIFLISVLLVYNKLTNGNFLTMGYETRYGENHGIGFGKTGYTDIAHTPFLGLKQVTSYFKSLNEDLFGWPLSSFFAIFPLFFFTRISPNYRRKDFILVSGFLFLLFGLFFYWGTYILIGARMAFEAIPLLFLLSARGLTEIPNLIISKYKKINQTRLKKVIVSILIIFIAFAFFIHLPQYIWPPDTEWYFDGFRTSYAAVTPSIHRTLQSLPLQNSLIIIKVIFHPIEFFPYGWWGSGFLYNDHQLRGNIIYCRDSGDGYMDLFRCFPGRKIYLYFGTLERGMLVPLKTEGNEIIYGEPISFEGRGKRYIELINDPKKFFKPYSAEFTSFLDKIYSHNHFYEIDVAKLIKQGTLYQNNKNYGEAAFYFEAALQIEKQPDIRYQILNLLSACYLKQGKNNEAKKIIKRIVKLENMKLFHILPEKGF